MTPTSNSAPRPYVRRFTRIGSALRILADYPDGLALRRLAELLDADPGELREEMLAFYSAEAATPIPFHDYRDPGLEFVSDTGEDIDPHEADIIVVHGEPLASIGVDRLTSAEMAQLWRTGQALLAMEPENATLAEALRAVADGWLEGAAAAISEPGEAWVAELRTAVGQCRVVRIEYSRAWRPGVFHRDIHPYRVVSGPRGWEVAAGPIGEDGMPRTYLLGNVRELVVTAERFVRPAGVDDLIKANRAVTTVRMVLPRDAEWAADRLAESVESVDADPDDLTVDVELLEPVAARVGLIIVATQGAGFVVSPVALADAGRSMAERLMAHHHLDLR